MSGHAPARRHPLRAVVWLGYWVLIFVGTHLPPSPVVRIAARLPDWLLHAGVFAGLGWLVVWAQPRVFAPGQHSPTALRRRAAAWYIVLLVYAGFDELTQPVIGRQAEWTDWAADAIGAALGMIVALIGRSHRGAPGREAKP
jgi:VanZ family protein